MWGFKVIETGKQRILIIAPHADDEILGCGGLIEKACRFKNQVKVVIGAIGDIRFEHNIKEIVTARTRENELKNALSLLGCTEYDILYRSHESFLDTIPMNEIVTKLDTIMNGFQPTMVFIPYPSFHQDHQVLFRACMSALRPAPNKSYQLIAMFEYPLMVWQYPKINESGELYLDISKSIDMKIHALNKHTSQIREASHLISPESVKKWAEKRGMETGCNYAEKYYILKMFLL